MHSSRMHTTRSSSRPGRGLPQCMLGYTTPLGVGLETPPPGVGLETPLDTCKTCWDTSPPTCEQNS